MADDAANFGVRGYSVEEGNDVIVACEEHAPVESITPEDYAILIEEYEWEDTFGAVKYYRCDVCGREQYLLEVG